MRGDVSSTTPKKQQLLRSAYLAIYSRTVVRQFLYVRRSYDIDTIPFAILEALRTYDWRKYKRWCADRYCLQCTVKCRFYEIVERVYCTVL